MSRCPIQPAPEWIGGHRVDGEAYSSDHLAFFALSAADPSGELRLVAAALLIPKAIADEEVDRVLRPILAGDGPDGAIRLWDQEHPAIQWRLRPCRGGVVPPAQTVEWWRGGAEGARRWCSMTPVVMDRHGSRRAEIQEAIERSCLRLRLPRPASVETSPETFVPGVPRSGA